MTRSGRRIVGGLLVIILMPTGTPVQAAEPAGPRAVDIHPAGWMSSSASDVNNRGEVIITATTSIGSEIQPPQGFVWRNGKHLPLRPLPGGNGSLPRDINERGEVVGFCQSGDQLARPCRWHQGRSRDLGTLDERGTGTALAINDRGEVVGDNQTFIRGGETRAFLWRDGVLTDLGGIGDFSATGINNSSQVIGIHYTEEGQRAFLWQRGVMTDLGTLGGSDTMPADINERGQIVGTSTTASGAQHAFLWERGRMLDLGTPSVESGALAINDRGEVVGWTMQGLMLSSWHWHRGVRTELAGSLGDINEQGWIGGSTRGDPRYALLIRNGRVSTGDPADAVMALNERGLLVGWLTGASGQHATVWR